MGFAFSKIPQFEVFAFAVFKPIDVLFELDILESNVEILRLIGDETVLGSLRNGREIPDLGERTFLILHN